MPQRVLTHFHLPVSGNRTCPVYAAFTGHLALGLTFCDVGSEEARLRAGLRPAPKLHVRFSRMKCAGAHFMRYVVSPVMWRRGDNVLAWLVAGPAQRHIKEFL